MNTIIPWLEHLKVLMPPKHISLVGAGNGKGTWARWLAHQTESRVTFVEADTLQCATLQRTLESLGQRAQCCEVLNTVVAAQPGTTSFLVASNQQESGLLEPLSLQSLWPNLQMEEARELSSITLDTLLSDLSDGVGGRQLIGDGHWLIIDCFPSADLLRASNKLGLVDVVIARVLLNRVNAMPDGMFLEEVADFLQQEDIVQVAVETTRHPAIGYALFVRDPRSILLKQAQSHRDEHHKQSLISEAQAKLARERGIRMAQATMAKSMAEKEARARTLQLKKIRKAYADQSDILRKLQVEINLLVQSKALSDNVAQERQVRIDELIKMKDDLIKAEEEKNNNLVLACVAAENISLELKENINNIAQEKYNIEILVKKQEHEIEKLMSVNSNMENRLNQNEVDILDLNRSIEENEEKIRRANRNVAALRVACEEQVKLAQTRQMQVSKLMRANADIESQLQQKILQLAAMSKARDEQVRIAKERYMHVERLLHLNKIHEVRLREFGGEIIKIKEDARLIVDEKTIDYKRQLSKMVELSESQQVKINNYSNHLLEAKARITQLNQRLREFKKNVPERK
ncbi:hypothetical protein [Comamonas thiooxydans]|uniref:hypothetical protein n=1 Tax=Comamonas thiooxydans TaxID=363952 RepID=UPI00057B11C6|nr:hypothetical protein [Comamonas thiooxydans]